MSKRKKTVLYADAVRLETSNKVTAAEINQEEPADPKKVIEENTLEEIAVEKANKEDEGNYIANSKRA